MQKLDYSVLTTPISDDEVAAYKKIKSGGEFILASYSYVWLVGLIAVALFFAQVLGLRSRVTYAQLYGIGGFMLTVATVIAYLAAARGRSETILTKFALANNATYIHDSYETNYGGVIFNEGDSRKMIDAIKFTDGSQLGQYQYKTGSGKSRQTHNWGFVSVKLPRRLPNMVLDSKRNNIFGFSNLPESLNSDQKLSLEGDFDKYFTLYAPQQYATDALYIFTPDVMQAAIDAGGKYDMEIIDDMFYVYTQANYNLSKKKNIQALVNIACKVGEEIAKQTDYYADTRVASRELNVVAVPGQRLKTGFSKLSIVMTVLYIIYILAHIVRGL